MATFVIGLVVTVLSATLLAVGLVARGARSAAGCRGAAACGGCPEGKPAGEKED